MGRKLYDWYFKRKVTEVDMDTIFQETRGYTNDFIADHLSPGFSAIPSLTQNSPTPDFTVDVNIPGSGGIVGYDKNGQRIGIPTTQGVDLGTVLGGPVTLPTSGNEKYVTLFVKYFQFQSDPQVDGNSNPVNFQLEDGWVFSVIQGTQATAGSAVKPTDPDDGRLIIGDILLTPTSTSILNAAIDQLRMKRLNLNDEIQGFDGNTASINAAARGVPTTGATQIYKFLRGSKVAGGIRLLEGASPNTDPPVIQVSVFTDSNTFSWSTLGTLSGWNYTGSYLEPLNPTTTKVKIGFSGAPNAASIFEVRSTTMGSSPVPAMTETQRDAIASPYEPMQVYNLTTKKYNFYNGTSWEELGTGGGSGGQDRRVYGPYTLLSGDITAKQITLPDTPVANTTEFYSKTSNHFFPADHFKVVGNLLIWDPAASGVGEGITTFVAGDEVVAVYSVPGTGGGSGFRTKIHPFTLDATDETNGYIDLPELPSDPLAVTAIIKGQGGQVEGVDFVMITNGSDLRRFSWTGLGLDGILIDGSKGQIIFEYAV
jgi:hypothetical protein